MERPDVSDSSDSDEENVDLGEDMTEANDPVASVNDVEFIAGLIECTDTQSTTVISEGKTVL